MLDGCSAKRFRVPEEAFVDGDRMRAFDAQPPVCCSLRVAGMQQPHVKSLRASALRLTYAATIHDVTLLTVVNRAPVPVKRP